MRQIRWVAVVPLLLGVVFLLVALAWTEWPQFFTGMILVIAAAALWRLFGGSWPIRNS